MDPNKTIKSISRFLKNHWQSWTILAIFAIIVCVGLMLYKYAYVPLYRPEEVVTDKLEIRENLYNSLIGDFSQKQENITEIFNKDYLNPFK